MSEFTIERNEAACIYEVSYAPMGVIAKAAFGTGLITATEEFHKKFDGVEDQATIDLYDRAYDEMEKASDMARKEEFLLPPALRQQILCIIELRKQLETEIDGFYKGIGEVLDDFDPEGFMNDPSESIEEENLMTCSVEESHGRTVLKPIDGPKHAPRATLERNGTFVSQNVGYCEDDFSGSLYLRFEKGQEGAPDKFLRLYYEC